LVGNRPIPEKAQDAAGEHAGHDDSGSLGDTPG
jgi:hypothetical protein